MTSKYFKRWRKTPILNSRIRCQIILRWGRTQKMFLSRKQMLAPSSKELESPRTGERNNYRWAMRHPQRSLDMELKIKMLIFNSKYSGSSSNSRLWINSNLMVKMLIWRVFQNKIPRKDISGPQRWLQIRKASPCNPLLLRSEMPKVVYLKEDLTLVRVKEHRNRKQLKEEITQSTRLQDKLWCQIMTLLKVFRALIKLNTKKIIRWIPICKWCL